MKRLVNLIIWKVDPTFTPRTPEERLKLWEQLQQLTKADLASGAASAWGVAVGGMEGFALTELDGEDLYLMIAKYSPICKFTVKKMLSIDEALDATQKMKQQLSASYT
jgi:hypothetical protein